jgi:DNA helicase HerA-like ATPase
MSENIIQIGKGESTYVSLQLKYINRHGLVTGATGSGKTVTLQVLSEELSRAGIPVIIPDIKGDLLGLASSGSVDEKIRNNLMSKGLREPEWQSYPVRQWEIGNSSEISLLKASVSTLGPLLLSRLLDLSEIQTSIVQVAFKIAREQNKPLHSLDDARNLFSWIIQNRENLTSKYGAIAESSLSAIQRGLIVLDEQEVNQFLSSAETTVDDFIKHVNGIGVINLIKASSLLHKPALYAVLFSWLLSRLYEDLPEVGDLPKPKLVLFIDEAHLLFETLSSNLQDNIERTIRLIRSKGVGIYFVTQLPSDIPENILGQLGNRIQHVLRAFTPRDQKAVQIAAETMRPNPNINIVSSITQLSPGEALISVLDESGTPTVTEKIWINMPASHIGIGSNPIFLEKIQLKNNFLSKNKTHTNSDNELQIKSQINKNSEDENIKTTIANGITKTIFWLFNLKK